MSTRYPGRPKSSNRSYFVGVKLDEHQNRRVRELAAEYKMPLSEIIREAIAVWLNVNSKGAK